MSSPTSDQPAPEPDPADPAPADVPAGAAGAERPGEQERSGQEPAGQEPAEQEPQDMTLLVDPARVRRAPRYPVFLWMGALVGVVVGLGFATWLVGVTGSGQALMKPGVYVTVVVLATTALFMGVAGLLAVLADRRSLRRR